MHARWRELIRGRSPSTQVEVAINALLLTRELIARGDLCRHKETSLWEDQLQREIVIEGGVTTGGSTLCELFRRHRASGALIPQEDRHRCELRELQIKLGLHELPRLVAVSIESFFVRFESFVVAAVRINLGLASLNSLTRNNLYYQLSDRV